MVGARHAVPLRGSPTLAIVQHIVLPLVSAGFHKFDEVSRLRQGRVGAVRVPPLPAANDLGP